MTYGHTISTLAASVDREFKTLSHPKEWADGFRRLKDTRHKGYFYGSPMDIWPLGAHEIFEGQARFSQIQYLSHACDHRLGWEAFRNLGLVHGVYVRAFEQFLHWTDSEWPDRIDHPLVGLFLLVCDLAINPAAGFPLPVTPNYETFLDDTNPGARFCMFCRVIALHFPELKEAVRDHSRSEYELVTEKLCSALKEAPPLLIARIFSTWFAKDGPFSSLRREYEAYKFELGNYVIRHLFAHFLALQEDKLKAPEFFCWPGAWMAGDLVSDASAALFNKHGALFTDKENDDAIFARLQPGRDEKAVQEAFNIFYQNIVTYEMTNQWIGDAGHFKYDIAWLSSSTSLEAKEYIRGLFMHAFDLDPESVTVLS